MRSAGRPRWRAPALVSTARKHQTHSLPVVGGRAGDETARDGRTPRRHDGVGRERRPPFPASPRTHSPYLQKRRNEATKKPRKPLNVGRSNDSIIVVATDFFFLLSSRRDNKTFVDNSQRKLRLPNFEDHRFHRLCRCRGSCNCCTVYCSYSFVRVCVLLCCCFVVGAKITNKITRTHPSSINRHRFERKR